MQRNYAPANSQAARMLPGKYLIPIETMAHTFQILKCDYSGLTVQRDKFERHVTHNFTCFWRSVPAMNTYTWPGLVDKFIRIVLKPTQHIGEQTHARVNVVGGKWKSRVNLPEGIFYLFMYLM